MNRLGNEAPYCSADVIGSRAITVFTMKTRKNGALKNMKKNIDKKGDSFPLRWKATGERNLPLVVFGALLCPD